MRIGEVAAAAGVSVRALRYYEEQNLLDAERSIGGQRHYADGAVERVLLIQQLYAAGLPSRTVREVLVCVHSGTATPTLLEQLAAERARVDQRIADLLSVRDRLDSVIATAQDPAARCELTPADTARPHGPGSGRDGRDGSAGGAGVEAVAGPIGRVMV